MSRRYHGEGRHCRGSDMPQQRASERVRCWPRCAKSASASRSSCWTWPKTRASVPPLHRVGCERSAGTPVPRDPTDHHRPGSAAGAARRRRRDKPLAPLRPGHQRPAYRRAGSAKWSRPWRRQARGSLQPRLAHGAGCGPTADPALPNQSWEPLSDRSPNGSPCSPEPEMTTRDRAGGHLRPARRGWTGTRQRGGAVAP
jgi:hypothetical protein